MSIVLFNPTNEKFRVTFGGRSFLIPPEGSDKPNKIKVEDACGKHVLNEYSQRGLCSLDYGDESKIEEIAEAGRATNRAFKIRQIELYNEQNEARKAIGLPFNTPTKTIIAYAQELSLKLSEPYRVEDTVAKESKALKEENVYLKDQVSYLQTQMIKLGEQMNKLVDAQGAKEEEPEKVKPESKKRGPKPKVKHEE